MRFSRWLNSLSAADQISILILCILSSLLSLVMIKIGLRKYNEYRKSQPFAPAVQMSPFGFFAIAIPILIIFYLLFGGVLTSILVGLGI
ncbi:MAG: hypothetical protein QF453_01680 [Candidatus Marinimicrobia bacterium]|nr:hypothetical protein [Candidatus Neomarinimicrobiota bacterium]|tara:strand:+ start:835 stop:1101 length:267 start_codon:yes stop_codon:yes gene_type:complete